MEDSQPEQTQSRGMAGHDESSREPLLVLHINDSTDDQVLFQAAAQEAGVPIEWHVAESAHQAISYFASLLNLEREHPVRRVDLVVLDIVLGDASGLMVLQYIRSTPALSRLPVVVFTGNMNPATIAQAYRLGVNAVHEKPSRFEDTVKLAATIYADWSRGAGKVDSSQVDG
jgi:CheY-like chemotaxis protein